MSSEVVASSGTEVPLPGGGKTFIGQGLVGVPGYNLPPNNVNPITGGADTPSSSRHGGRGDNCLYADGHVDISPNADFTNWDAYYAQGSPPSSKEAKNITYGAAH